MSTLKFRLAFVAFFIFCTQAFAQGISKTGSILTEPGVIIMFVLVLLPVAAGLIIMLLRLKNIVGKMKNKDDQEEASRFANYLANLEGDEIDVVLENKKKATEFRLLNNELSVGMSASDKKGLIGQINEQPNLGFVTTKKKALKRPNIDPELSKLILYFIITATFWLLFGTTVGEYMGIKFVAPDADHLSWLSFGRLRPVHTNAVFWGWSSLAMLGLGYYVVPMVSNVKIASLKYGWYSLFLINAAVVIGSICLMSGISNGGGEYREYLWPVMAMFGLALLLTLINFIKTIARRTTKEIYVSNWYIVAAIIFYVSYCGGCLLAFLARWFGAKLLFKVIICTKV